MAMSHANCTHPRTPAGRAACRKAGGPGATTTPTKVEGLAKVTDGKGKLVDWQVTPELVAKLDAKAKEKTKKNVKRPGTQIKGTPDMADVPQAFTLAIKTAHDKGWVVRAGEPYNDTERRLEVFAPHGTINLVWLASNPHGVHAVSFRAKDSSVWTRCVSVSAAFIMGLDGPNAA